MIRILVGSLLSAIVMYAWGFVWWMFLPIMNQVMHPIPNAETVVPILKENISESGVYLAPFTDMDEMSTMSDEEKTAFNQKHTDGPLIQITYRTDGVDMMSPVLMAMGFISMLLATLVAAILLSMSGITSYLARVLFVILLGVLVCFNGYLEDAIWFHHPLDYPFAQCAFTMSSWILAGLMLAVIVRPKPE